MSLQSTSINSVLFVAVTGPANETKIDDSASTGGAVVYQLIFFIELFSHACLYYSDAEGECNVTLRAVLSFFSGADSIPPQGYASAVLNFEPTNQYPTASTCAIQLTLPTKHEDYNVFKRQLDVAFTMHGGFGFH